MMGGHFTGKMPFDTVYIHGLVLDENGHKMSKSKNNGIDPLLLIGKYGTDALRYTLVKEVIGAGQNIRMEYDRKTDESKSVETSRNFTNKLWNAARFVMMNLEGQTPQQLGSPYPPQPPLAKGGREEDALAKGGREGAGLELCDRWIISRYYQVVQQSRTCLENYGLGEAAKGLYEFIWGDFCDWYIELVKSRLQQDAEPNSKKVAQQTFAFVLEGILKLLHPFMPHITEEIWHTLTQTGDGDCLALQAYPEPEPSLIDPELEQQFELLFGTIRTIRNLRADSDIKPSVKVTAILQTENEKQRQILLDGSVYIKDLAKVENLTVTASLDADLGQTIAGVVGTVQVLIPLAGVVDLVALRGKLEKKLAKVEAEIKHTAARLTNQKFVDKATPDVVQGARDALAESEKQAEILRDRLKLF
jgi:valyl-tRNA synthetase